MNNQPKDVEEYQEKMGGPEMEFLQYMNEHPELLQEETDLPTEQNELESELRYLVRSIWRHRDEFEGEHDAEARVIEMFRKALTTNTEQRVRERDEYWKAKIKKHFDAKIDEALSDQPKDHDSNNTTN